MQPYTTIALLPLHSHPLSPMPSSHYTLSVERQELHMAKSSDLLSLHFLLRLSFRTPSFQYIQTTCHPHGSTTRICAENVADKAPWLLVIRHPSNLLTFITPCHHVRTCPYLPNVTSRCHQYSC